MARSRWKLEYFSRTMWRKIMLLKTGKKLKRNRIYFDRSSSIPDCFFFVYIKIHKGKKTRGMLINQHMIGKKMGEFSYTRKPYHFPAKRSKKKNLLIRR